MLSCSASLPVEGAPTEHSRRFPLGTSGARTLSGAGAGCVCAPLRGQGGQAPGPPQEPSSPPTPCPLISGLTLSGGPCFRTPCPSVGPSSRKTPPVPSICGWNSGGLMGPGGVWGAPSGRVCRGLWRGLHLGPSQRSPAQSARNASALPACAGAPEARTLGSTRWSQPAPRAAPRGYGVGAGGLRV